jgi:WD40 repeat protein
MLSVALLVTAAPLIAQTPPQRVTRTPHAEAPRARAGLTSVRIAPTGQWVASAGLDGEVCVRTVPALATRWCRRHGSEVYAVRISADGRFVFAIGGDQQLSRWDARTGQALGRTRLPSRAVTMAWAGDTLLVVPTLNGDVLFVSPRTMKARVAWRVEQEVLAAAISADGEWLATAPALEIHRLRDGAPGRTVRAHAQGGLAYHPRGVALATAESVAGARLLLLGDSVFTRGLALPSVQEFGGLRPDTATVNMPSTDVTFSADGGRVVVAGTDGGVWHWALERDGRPIPPATTWLAHHGTVTSVDLARDGTWVVTAGLDGRLRLWKGLGAP